MTAPSLGRLLISHITLRGPELAQLYALVLAHPSISYDDLAQALVPGWTGGSEFGLEDATLREALNFLLVAHMLAQDGLSRRKASFRATPLLQGLGFAPLLLHHIHSHEDQRQRALSAIYRQLVADDVLALTPAALRERMERGALRDLFIWTGEKISLWAHLLAFLGLIRRLEREAELLILPQPELLMHALHWANTQCNAPPLRYGEGAGGEVKHRTRSLNALLSQIDSQLFACFTSRGRAHRGLAQTLLTLERQGQIVLSHSADAAQSLLLGERRVSDIALQGSANGL